MSDTIDDYRALNEWRRERRRRLGVNCPGCATARPKAHPTILLPQQRCRVCGYRDPRLEEQENGNDQQHEAT